MKPVPLIIAAAIVGGGAWYAWNHHMSDVSAVQPERGPELATDRAPPAAQIVATSGDRVGNYSDDFASLNKQRDGVITLESGVQYEVLEPGFGDIPVVSDTVIVRYVGSLPDGRVFDTTEEEQEPLSLPMESIAVPGLREALLLMDEGAHWRVVIPPSAGFGRSGNNRLRRHDLIYEIRLVAIEAGDA